MVSDMSDVFICTYHGQFLPVAGRDTVSCIFSEITLITHEHDGNILTGHILPNNPKRQLIFCVIQKSGNKK